MSTFCPEAIADESKKLRAARMALTCGSHLHHLAFTNKFGTNTDIEYDSQRPDSRRKRERARDASACKRRHNVFALTTRVPGSTREHHGSNVTATAGGHTVRAECA
jgi:hypothetical protein